MAYIGIGYNGEDPRFLPTMVEKNSAWLKGDRIPRFFGDQFLLLYDSNIAREFAKKCTREAPPKTISIFTMERPLEI